MAHKNDCTALGPNTPASAVVEGWSLAASVRATVFIGSGAPPVILCSEAASTRLWAPRKRAPLPHMGVANCCAQAARGVCSSSGPSGLYWRLLVRPLLRRRRGGRGVLGWAVHLPVLLRRQPLTRSVGLHKGIIMHRAIQNNNRSFFLREY